MSKEVDRRADMKLESMNHSVEVNEKKLGKLRANERAIHPSNP
jgi:hypothetical protein